MLRAKARGHRDLVTVVGHAAIISAGEWITASGEWINDRAHGLQFKRGFSRPRAVLRILESAIVRSVRSAVGYLIGCLLTAEIPF